MRASRLVHGVAAAVLLLWMTTGIAGDPGQLPKVGELWMSTPETASLYRNAFHAGLHDLGYRDGQNIRLIIRHAQGNPANIPGLIDELAAENVDVMLLIPTAVPIAQKRVPTIPVVCGAFFDPVVEGVVTSLARPGGNVTGLSWQSPEAASKRVELAKDMIPALKQIAVIFADNDRGAIAEADITVEDSRRLGLRVDMFPVRDAASIDEALSQIQRARPQALLAVNSSLTTAYSAHIAAFAIKAKIPLISETEYWTNSGALLAYGPDGVEIFRRAATYVDRVLKGVKAGDIPIEQPRKFLLIVNQKTAGTLGLRIPQSILQRADEVIR